MNYDRLREALAEFDASAPGRHHAWMIVYTDAGVADCKAADLAALRKLQQVFYEETQEFNSLSNCHLLSDHDIRRVLRRRDLAQESPDRLAGQ